MKSAFKKVLKKILILGIIMVILFSVPAGATVKSIETDNDATIKLMYQWLAGTQFSNGALPVYGVVDGDATIVPYFSSIATLAILKYETDDESLNIVKKYYDWYLGNLIGKDAIDWGAIYDYRITVENKEVVMEKSKDDYDSADSYAALFIISLWEYAKAGGDTEYIIENEEKIYSIINHLTSLIDENDLSRVSRENGTKYLMDNCEVTLGLYSAYQLIEKVYLKQYRFFSKQYWATVRDVMDIRMLRHKMIKAIEENMWSESKQCYDLGVDKNGKVLEFDSWEDFYPDAVAQLFPIVFGIINPNRERAKTLYNRFCKTYDWENLSHYKNDDSSFYWGIIAYCGAKMGDNDRVNQYIESFGELALPDFEYPAYNADVAWTILAGIYQD